MDPDDQEVTRTPKDLNMLGINNGEKWQLIRINGEE